MLPGKQENAVEADVHSEEFLHRLMRRQLRLSVLCAALFLTVLLALPLANYFLPELMSRRIGGFTLTWLLLGVLFFPLVWIISWFFIRRSIALEEEEIRWVRLDSTPDQAGAKAEAALGSTKQPSS